MNEKLLAGLQTAISHYRSNGMDSIGIEALESIIKLSRHEQEQEQEDGLRDSSSLTHEAKEALLKLRACACHCSACKEEIRTLRRTLYALSTPTPKPQADSLESLTHRVSMYSQIINEQADEIAKLKAKTEVEPLAAIIAKAGFWYHTIYHLADGEWDIRLGTNSRNALSTEERFNAPTYPAAEQAARKFLNQLPDKEPKNEK